MHSHNTHSLWKTIHGLSNRVPPPTLNTPITFNKKITTTPRNSANCISKQCTNTVRHATHKTHRSINRATHKIQGYNITLTTIHVQEAIKQSKHNKSQGPDKLNIMHLKHIGHLGLAFLTSMLKTALNTNIITHLTFGSPHPKTHQRHRQGHLIQAHIPPLSNCKYIGEEPSSLHNSKHIKHTHASRVQNTTLYSNGTTRIKRTPYLVQPNSSPCANNHCSTRYEQSFRHNKHTHTYQKAAKDQDSRYNH